MFDVESNLAGSSPFADVNSYHGVWRLQPRTQMILLVLCGLAQVAILAAMIVLDGLPLLLGQRVKLNVVPVDPRDLFRGDYVVLGYDFTTGGDRIPNLPLASRDAYRLSGEGEDVYISLTPEGDHHVATSIGLSPPGSGIYLQGKRIGYNRIECGIEAYYVQEGEGRQWEEGIRSRKVQAEVAIWNGKGKLVRLLE